MSFAHPYLLLLLLLLPLLIWLHGRRRGTASFLYSSTQLVRNVAVLNRSHATRILLFLRWLALALGIVALSQPRLVENESEIQASGIDMVIAIDLSMSMAAEDFELKGQRVNRLVIAKDVLEKFIRNRKSDRIGLVAFAGKAYIAAPITLDHDFLIQNMERLWLGMIEDSTAIGAGLAASVNRLKDLKAKSKIVILMTDGQNNAGKISPATATELAMTLGVKVYTIGVGTRGEAPFPFIDMFTQQKRYQMRPVDIDEKTLQEIAQKTGGKYFRADNSEMFSRIYKEIDTLEKTESKSKKHLQYQELFHWVVLGALFCLLLETILSQTVWRKLP
jgi:Ca-activated chloride channel family protein